MLLRFRVRGAIAKFIMSDGLHADVLSFLEAGALDAFMPLIERAGFDGDQGAITVITGAVTNIASNNGFIHLMNTAPCTGSHFLDTVLQLRPPFVWHKPGGLQGVT